MRSIKIQAEIDSQILFTTNWRDELDTLIGERRALLVISSDLAKVIDVSSLLKSSRLIFKVPNSEAQKDFDIFRSGADFLAANEFSRGDLIVGIGGGATTDLAGFLAATWLRGVEWIAVPTSLAGMVDAAIGGKTAINSKFGKNLIGAFHSPSRVLIALELLESLPDRDFRAGVAEIIKAGFIGDAKILSLLESATRSFTEAQDYDLWEEIIFRSIGVKAKIVGEDFKESSSREFLNYGHTLGHAIEQHSSYSLRHGEAVAIGLMFASALSQKYAALEQNLVNLHRALIAKFELPQSYDRNCFEELYQLMLRDKKRRGSNVRFVLLAGVEQPLGVDHLTKDQLQETYEEVMQ
jgi:3-dehydroquinate synthase